MKSRAHINGHPLHPILVSFPIAFFTGTLLFDILGVVLDRGEFWIIGYYLQITGVLFALVTAIPGIIDFIYTVPPKSSAKKRAAKHGLTNVTVVILMAVIWFYRRQGDSSPTLILAGESIGVILMSIAGWLGGTLVYRNQIGVDPRYAHAGEWRETTVDNSGKPVEVATEEELKVNQMKLVRAGDRRIVIGRTESGYVAFDDHCTHKGGSLAGGSMICGKVQCPWHGSQFDVTSGVVVAGPAVENIHTYHLHISNGKVYLSL